MIFSHLCSFSPFYGSPIIISVPGFIYSNASSHPKIGVQLFRSPFPIFKELLLISPAPFMHPAFLLSVSSTGHITTAKAWAPHGGEDLFHMCFAAHSCSCCLVQCLMLWVRIRLWTGAVIVHSWISDVIIRLLDKSGWKGFQEVSSPSSCRVTYEITTGYLGFYWSRFWKSPRMKAAQALQAICVIDCPYGA